MSLRVSGSAGTPSAGVSARQLSRLRNASFASFVLLLVQTMIGIGVNLYIKVPGAAHSAVGLVVQTAIARDRILLAPSIVGLITLILAVVSGASFVDKGQASASLAMAIFTGVALLAYGTNLYLLAARRGTEVV
jgi:hypothetical protein